MAPRFTDALRTLLALPRGQQPAALGALLASYPEPNPHEAWNTRFGPGSLYDAFADTELMRALYGSNAAVVGRHLAERPGWRVVEVGGGDGRLWSRVLGLRDHGELVLVDPVEEVHAVVARRLPAGVRLTSLLARVEDVAIPEADAVVCSLVLHHVAGRDAGERARSGLAGPGKREVLERIAEAIAPRDGILVVNEADVHCDLELAPGDPVLVERLLDSYVRRCALALAHDIDQRSGTADDLKQRWEAVALHWCLEQVALADAPVAERDVYELDVPRWIEIFERAGLVLRERRFTDRYNLFHQYVLQAGRTGRAP